MKFAICCYPGHELEKIKAACEFNSVDYEVVDLLANDWMEQAQSTHFSAFLVRPTCSYDEHKAIFDERCYFLKTMMAKIVYPTFNDIYVYENKRNMANWLRFLNVPHPITTIIATKSDAEKFLENTEYPIVTKANVGSAGSAVQILKNKNDAKKLVNKIFGRFHSEFALGNIPWGRFKNIPFPRISRSQRHYMVCQNFIDLKWEWRIIRVGDYYFGHQKLMGDNGFASGSDLVGWNEPPRELLDLTYDITQKMNSRTMAVDIFETNNGEFYVNELQPIFGSYKPSQMYIDNKPGRFKRVDGEYVFEEGEFCQNACWNMRVEDLVKQLEVSNGKSF